MFSKTSTTRYTESCSDNTEKQCRSERLNIDILEARVAMGELILHIGTRKTGTTSLQKFFYDNRDVLLRNGVDYIQFTRQKAAPYKNNRNGVFLSRYCEALSLKKEIDNYVNDFEENYNRLAMALKGNNRVLISDEDLSNLSIKKYGEKQNPETYWRELARVIGNLEPSKTTIIVYLRRQDEYVVSTWKERVKGGFINNTFREYLRDPNRKYELDYTIMLDAISNSFGSAAKIIVRSYNKASSSPDGIFRDFCDALEIPWDNDYKKPTSKINKSLSFDAAEAVRTCKYGMYVLGNEEKRKKRKKAIAALSSKYPDPKGTTIFMPGEAESFMKQFSEANRRIEEEYCDNKPLFSNEFNKGPIWQPNRLRIAKYRAVLMCLRLPKKLRSFFGPKLGAWK